MEKVLQNIKNEYTFLFGYPQNNRNFIAKTYTSYNLYVWVREALVFQLGLECHHIGSIEKVIFLIISGKRSQCEALLEIGLPNLFVSCEWSEVTSCRDRGF